MSLAKTPDTTPTPCDEFDLALTQAQTITTIISYLADVNGLGDTPLSCFALLAEELNARLERIEVADMAMRRART